MSGRVKNGVKRCVIRLDQRLADYREEVNYVLEEVSARLRFPVVLARDGDSHADIDLALDAVSPGGIRFDPRCYDRRARFSAARFSGKTLWVPEGTRAHETVDHVGAIFRLLTLLDETAVEPRNRLGVFSVSALPEARHETRMLSLVENHCQMLGHELGIDTADTTTAWPGGRRYCVLLTHDTDAAALSAFGEIVTNLGKAVVRRDVKRLELVRLGLRHRSRRETDPLFAFPAWQRELNHLGINSAFYISIVRGSQRDRHDVRSDVFFYPDSRLDIIRDMIASGSEIGLHASIGSRDNLDFLLSDKQQIEKAFRVPVRGIRHHYWSIDWVAPYKSYRLHENAGFRYDLSSAWQDSAGFRAGTSFPFRPYDPGRRRPLDLYVIPTAVLDDHVIQGNGDTCSLSRDFATVKNEVAAAGGVLCIDLHSEAASNLYPYEGHARVLLEELQTIVAEGDAWITTPWELIEYWHPLSVKYSERLSAPV